MNGMTLKTEHEYKNKIAALKAEIEKLKKKETQKIKNTKYGLNWIDVPEAFEEESKDSIPILEEVKEKAIKNDDGKPTHIMIEGDNFHALTCLNYTHAGKIDVIYIDPPYNIGNDFIYKDSRFLEEYPDGSPISKEHPLRHSAWLSFMNKRLKLAQKLLSNKGTIYISIDDNEYAQLKLLCDKIFGAEYFVGNIAWESKTKSQNTKTAYDKLQPKVEHILVYARRNHFNLFETGTKEYPESDDRGKFRYYKIEVMSAVGVRGRDTMVYSILGVEPPPRKQWKLGQETITFYEERGDLLLINNEPTLKIRPDDEKNEITEPFWGFISKDIGTAESAKKELNEILYPKNPGFETVKPIKLIEKLIFHASGKNSVILDFFAGSGTTLNSVINTNVNFGGTRQVIIIQNPEKTFTEDENGIKAKKGYEDTFNAGYNFISQITYERCEKIIQGYTNSKGEKIQGLGNSLKYYRTAFVGKNSAQSATDEDRISLSQKAGSLISLSENTLEEIKTTGFYQIFSDGKNYTAIYFSEDLSRFYDFVKEVESKNSKVSVYIFSWGSPEDFKNDFSNLKNIQIKAIPKPILEIYKSLNGGLQ